MNTSKLSVQLFLLWNPRCSYPLCVISMTRSSKRYAASREETQYHGAVEWWEEKIHEDLLKLDILPLASIEMIDTFVPNEIHRKYIIRLYNFHTM